MSAQSVWPPVQAAQIDYERLRALLLAYDRLPEDLAADRFARRGLAGPTSPPTIRNRIAGTTIREICRRLNAEAPPSPTGRATWGHSTLSRLLRNEAYVGRVYYNHTETIATPGPGRRTRQVPLPREEWIAIDCPPLIIEAM